MKSRQTPKRKAAATPAEIEIDIEKYSHDGRGLGHYHGRVVFVSNAMPNERVKVKIEAANSKLWQGKAVAWLTTSEARLTPACRWFGNCGGCTLQYVPQQHQVALKQQALVDHLQRNRVAVEAWQAPIVSTEFQYRHRARLQVNKQGAVGFYAQKENRIVAVDNCPVLVPALEQAIETLRLQAPLLGVQQIEVVEDDISAIGLQVIDASPVARNALSNWAQQQGWVIDQPMQYRALGCQQTAKPGEFTQVNRAVNEAMVQQTIDWLALKANDRVLDLFCGNGNFSLPFAATGAAVLGLEGSKSAIEQAILAAQQAEGSVDFEVVDLFTTELGSYHSIQAFAPTAVVLDPPRAGAENVVSALVKWPSVKKIVYVACDPATLARDLAVLISAGWKVGKAGVVDMFPHTRHIESMVLLER